MTAKSQLMEIIDVMPETLAGELLTLAEILRQRQAYGYDLDVTPVAAAEDFYPEEQRQGDRSFWDAYSAETHHRLEDLRAQLGY